MLSYAIDADDAEFDIYDDEASADPYEEIRKVLLPEYQHLSPEAIEQLLKQNLGENFSPEDAENFLRTLGQVGATVLPVAGTVVGTVFGGPVGGALGGALGSVAGNAIGSATAPRPPAQRPAPPPPPPRPRAAPAQPVARSVHQPVARQAPPPVARPVSPPIAQPVTRQAPPPMPSVRQPQPMMMPPPMTTQMSGTSAATQLLSAILQPQVLQALLAMAIGAPARQSISVGDVQVPVGAFANMLGVLGSQAVQQNPTPASPATSATPDTPPDGGESIPAYLMDASGNLMADPAVPEARAMTLFNRLQQANREQLASEGSERRNPLRHQQTLQAQMDEMYDALELADMYGDADYDDWEGC